MLHAAVCWLVEAFPTCTTNHSSKKTWFLAVCQRWRRCLQEVQWRSNVITRRTQYFHLMCFFEVSFTSCSRYCFVNQLLAPSIHPSWDQLEDAPPPPTCSTCMVLFYRKCSDMTARIIRPAVEGTSDLLDMERQKGRGSGVFPALWKGDDPAFHPPFWEITISVCRSGKAPGVQGEIPHISSLF